MLAQQPKSKIGRARGPIAPRRRMIPMSAIGPTRRPTPEHSSKLGKVARFGAVCTGTDEAMTTPELFSGNRFLAALQPADRDRLAAHITTHTLEAGASVNESATEVDAVYFPDGAVLSVVTTMQDGRGVESCSIGCESAYGALAALGSRISHHRVIAQIPGKTHRMSSTALREAAALSPSLTHLITRHAQAQAAMTEQSAACNAIHHVNARLCRWLLLSQDRARSGVLPLTQEFLGYMLGVQRTTVTAAARTLQAAGLIRYSRGRVELLNRQGLEAASCECYRVVRAQTDEILGPES